MDEPLVPDAKLNEARALWEISLFYIAMAAAARTIAGGAQGAGAAAAGGYRASQLLARAYYRLIRAAWTGYTIADRGDTPGSETSLRELYSDFETLAYRAIPDSRHADVRERVRIAGSNYEDALDGLIDEHEADLSTDDERYPDDPDLIEAGEEFTSADGDDYAADPTDDRDWGDEKDIAVEALEEAERLLEDLEEAEREELKKLQDRIKEIDSYQAKLAKKIEQAERRRRLKIQAAKDRGKHAGAAMKAAQQGARTAVATIAAHDNRAIGWVSVPRGEAPCYWCMMLASRGLMLYRSDMGATTYSDLWHDNCKCVTEAVFSRDHYFTSPTFARNRLAYNLWGDFAGGRNSRGRGNRSVNMSAWRSYFDSRYRKGRTYSDIARENSR